MATFGSGSESSQISQNCPSRRSFNPCHHCSELLEPQTIYRSHRVSSRRYSRASRRERGRHDFLLHSIAFAPKEACTVGSPIAPKPDSAPCYSTPARPLWLGGTNLVSEALLDWFQGALCWKIGHKGALRKNCRFRHQAGVFGSQITTSAEESGHHPGEGTNDEDRSNGNDIRCSFSWSLPSHGAAVWVGLCRRWK
jgi:hypothetical protein